MACLLCIRKLGLWLITWMHEGWKLKLWAYCYRKSEEDHFVSINWLPPDLCIQTSRSWYTNKTIPQNTCIYLVPCFMIGTLQPHLQHTRLYNHHTYALVASLLIVHTLHITSYCEPHALVHISTCTCIFQHAPVHLYVLTCSLGHSTPCCTYGNIPFLEVPPNRPHYQYL